jgi:osmotically-inducible protein OsmY
MLFALLLITMPRILALLLLPVLAGTLLLPAGASTPPKTAPVVNRAVNDAQLEATIHAKLAKSKIGKDGFRFHVQRGVVTWEGTTAVGQHKGAATRMARTSGAVQVINNIKVTGKPAGPMRKAYVQP